ncbi:hypothetical protein WICPIJ_004238 [Wickerhamomyces pijperi]|uniref:3-isopropylmalate dehydratase n=1 Tax=Wickerhamomyces pijperi TaxID=599730 RepID=A0A9P8Q8C4_WICPI|nr:hypothetical protein WICPIJ_004238 [Wickerhamomyces pijperi]
MAGQTLYDKVFQDHIVHKDESGSYLLYIDRHLVHEVTSPQAFEGLKNANRNVRRRDCTLATVDHNIPTESRKNFKSIETFIQQQDSKLQVQTLAENVKDFNVPFFGMTDDRQGIVHIIGPEQGFTLPGTTVVCGDSHTSTHGAFGALAFGIGTSEVEHVLATQTIIQAKSKNMRIFIDGDLSPGITSKDLVLHVIGVIGTAGGTGCVMEFQGLAIQNLSMEARMSICNMAIEAGARAGMIRPDQTTYDYVKGRPLAPAAGAEWEKAVAYWNTLYSDDDAVFDYDITIKASDIIPTITWGTSPQDALPITGSVPDPALVEDPIKKSGMERALKYMGLVPNTKFQEIPIDKVFIGSCTNARIEDLRAAAKVVKGHTKAANVKRCLVVPGSGLVKKQAEKEGLDKIFTNAGFEWREAGCSMCLGMNPDILDPEERCASTSNRNFEGRQGALSRTHLMSPAMAAAAGIKGYFTDIRDFEYNESAESIQISYEEEDKALQDAVYDHEKKPLAEGETESELEEDEVKDIPPTDHTVKQTSTAEGSAPVSSNAVNTITAVTAPLDRANVDTDAIIPKQFLKTIKRTGLKNGLFYESRFTKGPDGKDVATDFVLNVAPYDKAEILLVTGDNFGCGSSREHAPWALKDFGIKSIIAPSFGDIFYNNSFKNFLLPIRLPQEVILEKLYPIATKGEQLTIDLPNQQIRGPSGEVLVEHFDVEPFRKHCLVNGLDDIGLTLQKEEFIIKYETMRKDKFSFIEQGSRNIVPVRGAKKSKFGLKTQEW